MDRKTCTKCLKDLCTSAFNTRSVSHDGLSSRCTKCLREDAAERYASNPEKYLSKVRNKKYGISDEFYEHLVSSHNGVCAICGGLSNDKYGLHVDHDHKSGVVRGLLCNLCNRGLGNFKDNPELLRNAIEYLNIVTMEGK